MMSHPARMRTTDMGANSTMAPIPNRKTVALTVATRADYINYRH